MKLILPVTCADDNLAPAEYALLELNAKDVQRLIDMISHVDTLNQASSPFDGNINEIRVDESWCSPWFTSCEGLDDAIEWNKLGYAVVTDEFAAKLSAAIPPEEIRDAIVETDYEHLVVCSGVTNKRIYFSCYWRHTGVLLETCSIYLDSLYNILKEVSQDHCNAN